MRFVKDWDECFSLTEALLTGRTPVFINRVGGSDTNALANFMQSRVEKTVQFDAKFEQLRGVVQSYNGYYDLENSRGRYINYLETLLQCYKSTPDIVLCNPQLLTMYLPEMIHPRFLMDVIEGRRGYELLMDAIALAQPASVCLPYTFVEKLASHPLTLFNVFSRVLRDKKVLVVSPFSESIQANFHRRGQFFKNHAYPEFELRVCTTPITYAGLPREFYPDANWFATTERLKALIQDMEFDVALLSCGSYAVPLGCYIRDALKKQAVYVGGVLQLYFGIMGRRYAGNAFFEDQINADSFIYPIESERYLRHVSVLPDTAREAFGAYF